MKEERIMKCVPDDSQKLEKEATKNFTQKLYNNSEEHQRTSDSMMQLIYTI
jgi:hypothetical protein